MVRQFFFGFLGGRGKVGDFPSQLGYILLLPLVNLMLLGYFLLVGVDLLCEGLDLLSFLRQKTVCIIRRTLCFLEIC